MEQCNQNIAVKLINEHWTMTSWVMAVPSDSNIFTVDKVLEEVIMSS